LGQAALRLHHDSKLSVHLLQKIKVLDEAQWLGRHSVELLDSVAIAAVWKHFLLFSLIINNARDLTRDKWRTFANYFQLSQLKTVAESHSSYKSNSELS